MKPGTKLFLVGCVFFALAAVPPAWWDALYVVVTILIESFTEVHKTTHPWLT